MKHRIELCFTCRYAGQSGWGALIAGAIIGVLPVSPGWDEASAYVVAVGLLILLATAVAKQVTSGWRGPPGAPS